VVVDVLVEVLGVDQELEVVLPVPVTVPVGVVDALPVLEVLEPLLLELVLGAEEPLITVVDCCCELVLVLEPCAKPLKIILPLTLPEPRLLTKLFINAVRSAALMPKAVSLVIISFIDMPEFSI
jgi:hypothetical protein